MGCGPEITEHDVPSARTRQVSLSGTLHEVDARFLSLAVDSAQLVGGRWWSPDARVEAGGGETEVATYDFTQPRLRRLTALSRPPIYGSVDRRPTRSSMI